MENTPKLQVESIHIEDVLNRDQQGLPEKKKQRGRTFTKQVCMLIYSKEKHSKKYDLRIF